MSFIQIKKTCMNPADKCTVLASFIRHNDQHRNMHDATEFSTFTFVSFKNHCHKPQKTLTPLTLSYGHGWISPVNLYGSHWTTTRKMCILTKLKFLHYTYCISPQLKTRIIKNDKLTMCAFEKLWIKWHGNAKTTKKGPKIVIFLSEFFLWFWGDKSMYCYSL